MFYILKAFLTFGLLLWFVATTAMVCGLVDIEFCKLVLGLQSQGSDKFLNSNVSSSLRENHLWCSVQSHTYIYPLAKLFRSIWLQGECPFAESITLSVGTEHFILTIAPFADLVTLPLLPQILPFLSRPVCYHLNPSHLHRGVSVHLRKVSLYWNILY